MRSDRSCLTPAHKKSNIDIKGHVAMSVIHSISAEQTRRKLASVGGVSISVCTESIKHQKEYVPNINWPITLIFGGGTHSPPPFSWGGGAVPSFLCHCSGIGLQYHSSRSSYVHVCNI